MSSPAGVPGGPAAAAPAPVAARPSAARTATRPPSPHLLTGQPWWEALWADVLTPLDAALRARLPPLRSLPPYVFACLNLLALLADLSGALAARHWAAGLGVALALRALGGSLTSLHPGFGGPAQRGPALVALLGGGLFYGGVLGPAAFPGTRHLADAAAVTLAVLRVPPPSAAGLLATREGVDGVCRALGLLGAAATLVASVPALFEWELVGAHERVGGAAAAAAAGVDVAGGVSAGAARGAAGAGAGAARGAAAGAGEEDTDLPSARVAAAGAGARRRAAAQ